LPQTQASIWIHGEGVGEFLAAGPLIQRLQAICPDRTLLLTSSSAPVRRWLERHHPDATVLPLPWDVRSAVRRWFSGLRPRLLLLLDFAGGFCPGALIRSREDGVPVVVVNGRFLAPPRPLRYGLAEQLGLNHSIRQFIARFCVEDASVESRLREG